MNIQNFGIIKVLILGLPFGSLGKKCHLDIAHVDSRCVYYRQGVVPLPNDISGRVKLMFEVILTKFIAPRAFNLQ
jgi:hypothetical protein